MQVMLVVLGKDNPVLVYPLRALKLEAKYVQGQQTAYVSAPVRKTSSNHIPLPELLSKVSFNDLT